MALFKKDEKKSEGETTAIVSTEAQVVSSHAKAGGLDLGSIIVRPHVTEKATDLAERLNVYAFEISPAANKAQVKQAIEKLFKVTPTKIAIISIKSKLMRSRKNNQVVLKKPGLKKALVTLKTGDKIEFV